VRWKYYNGALPAIGSFGHVGLGGVGAWIDPINEIVGVYLSVLMHRTQQFDPLWTLDLFQDVVTAAVAD
jgi:CubicO group peptidase (beta-lactamase class C family)